MNAAADAEAKKKIKTLTRTDFLIQFLWKPVDPEPLPEDPEERKAKLEEQAAKVKADVKDWIDKMTEAEKEKDSSAVKIPSADEIEAASKAKTKELESAIDKAMSTTLSAPTAPGAPGAPRRRRRLLPQPPPRPLRRHPAHPNPSGRSGLALARSADRARSWRTRLLPIRALQIRTLADTIVREKAHYTMDQLKEFLRQCVKYRFWISLGVAALFAIIAYFVGSGPVKAAADQKTKTITTSARGEGVFLAGHPQRAVQAHRRGEDRDPHQGRQLGVEATLQPAGPFAHLARAGSEAISRVGPRLAGKGRRGGGRARQGRLYRGLSRICRPGLQDLQALRPRDGQGRRLRPPRRHCSGPSRSTRTSCPSWATSGRPRNGSGSSGRPSRSWPRSTRTRRIGTRPSSSRSTSWKSATARPRTSGRSPRANRSSPAERSLHPAPENPAADTASPQAGDGHGVDDAGKDDGGNGRG